MRTVRIPREVLERIEAEARSAYPDEACGFLFSRDDTAGLENRTISSAEPASNEFNGERRRRFVISAGELRTAEARGSARGEVVSGFYHSHPDHPAVPSAFDTEHAWPWYTYVVVSVERSGVRSVGAFELGAKGNRFFPCELTTQTGRAAERASRSPLTPGLS